jgi:hypothetical protein
MEIKNVLIIGWEIFPYEFKKEDEEGEPHFVFEDIDAECAYHFTDEIAHKFDLNSIQSGFVGDNSDRYFLSFNDFDEVDAKAEKMSKIMKDMATTEDKLVEAKLVEEGSFFVGSSLCYS